MGNKDKEPTLMMEKWDEFSTLWEADDSAKVEEDILRAIRLMLQHHLIKSTKIRRYVAFFNSHCPEMIKVTIQGDTLKADIHRSFVFKLIERHRMKSSLRPESESTGWDFSDFFSADTTKLKPIGKDKFKKLAFLHWQLSWFHFFPYKLDKIMGEELEQHRLATRPLRYDDGKNEGVLEYFYRKRDITGLSEDEIKKSTNQVMGLINWYVFTLRSYKRKAERDGKGFNIADLGSDLGDCINLSEMRMIRKSMLNLPIIDPVEIDPDNPF